MTDNSILNKVIMYYMNELTWASQGVNNKLFKPQEVVNNAITRCLGVAQFVQYFDVKYEGIDREYNKIKEKLEKLLDKSTKA